MSRNRNMTARAIFALVPDAKCAIVDGRITEWHTPDIPQPTQAAIDAEIARLQLADAIAGYRVAVEAHIEATARERDYSSAVSAASYVASTNAAWAAEAGAFVAWRDAVWIAVYEALDEWQAGGDAPTIDDLIASLPPMAWPGG
jgi:hypothetical protein